MEHINIQTFQRIAHQKAVGFIDGTTLSEFADDIRTGKYRSLEKSQTPGVVFQCTFDKLRRITHLQSFTGYWAFDIDKCYNTQVAEYLRDKLFAEVPAVRIAFLSKSQIGVKMICHFPETTGFNSNIDEIKLSRAKVKKWYHRTINNHFRQAGYFNDLILDYSQGTITQPVFYSFDPNLRTR
jgi:hypothetical protein